METNFDLLNYLNLINEKFGSLYLKQKLNFLPENFVLTSDLIKERLALNEAKKNISLPSFIFENKKIIKNNFKNALKNIKKFNNLIKNSNFFENNLKNKILFDLNLRLELLKFDLKQFNTTAFNEEEAYKEIFAINPIISDYLDESFYHEVDLESFVNNINTSYNPKLQKLLEELKEKIKNKKLQMEISSKNVEMLITKTTKQKENPKLLAKPKTSQKEVKPLKQTENKTIKKITNQKEKVWYKQSMFLWHSAEEHFIKKLI